MRNKVAKQIRKICWDTWREVKKLRLFRTRQSYFRAIKKSWRGTPWNQRTLRRVFRGFLR